MKNILASLCFLLGFQLVSAQNDTIQLQESNLSDRKIMRASQTQNVITLSDSVMKRSQPSLTNLLNFNTSIYFKENGAGMVSSPSFRGTTASQTVVLWNGININSQTTGQTDFNTVNIRGFDKINVKGGGGNVAETNNSVGGRIELINELNFKNQFTNELFAKYGSFNTFGANFDSKYSSQDFSFNVGLARYSSDNDFDFYDNPIQDKNVNGQFYNNNASLALGYKIDPKNTLKFFGNIFQAKRNLAVVTPYATKMRYEDYNTRSLITWDSRFGKFDSDLKLAYLTEKYRFFDNIVDEDFESGEVKTINAKYNLNYNFSNKIQFSAILDYIRNEGFSGLEMGMQQRDLGSVSLSAKHKIHPKFYYELSIRQELTEDYGNPFLYSLGGKWDAADFYRIKFNASKNFRIPTYNDLYTPKVGNPNLLPESSYQAEITNEFHNRIFTFSVTAYYNWIENLIRWIPNSNYISGGLLWTPENVEDVNMCGIESVFSARKSFGNHHISLNGTYGYTISHDQKLDKQLIYVPFHKATASFGYGWKGFSMYYQFLFNGKIYHTTRNEAEHQLDHYFVSNLGLDYDFGKSNIYKVGFEILNLMDYEYEAVQARPMPGRNFHFFINIKI